MKLISEKERNFFTFYSTKHDKVQVCQSFPGILVKFPMVCFPTAARTWDFKSFSHLHIVILKHKLNRDQTFKKVRTSEIRQIKNVISHQHGAQQWCTIPIPELNHSVFGWSRIQSRKSKCVGIGVEIIRWSPGIEIGIWIRVLEIPDTGKNGW